MSEQQQCPHCGARFWYTTGYGVIVYECGTVAEPGLFVTKKDAKIDCVKNQLRAAEARAEALENEVLWHRYISWYKSRDFYSRHLNRLAKSPEQLLDEYIGPEWRDSEDSAESSNFLFAIYEAEQEGAKK